MNSSYLNQLRKELILGNNSSLKEIFSNYGSYCIGTLIKKTSCTEEDAEDIFMDSVLNFREKIISGHIEYLTNTKAYLFSTCYRMWLTRYNQEKNKLNNTEEIIESIYGNHVDSIEKDIKLKIGLQALSKLGEQCQEIIRQFYIENKSMREIADFMGFANQNVAKTTKSRCFKKLIKEVTMIQEEIKSKGI